MKKVILLALTALMVVGCFDQEDVAKSVEERDFSTIKYDSCEYLFRAGMSGSSYLAHKGNCRFCEERDSIKWEKRRQKELEELVTKLKEK